MKKIIIVHGWEGYPEEPLHQYLKKGFENIDYKVVVPNMPNPSLPILSFWVEEIEKNFDNDVDVLVGHSMGCLAILRFLETRKEKIKIPKVVLIAPFLGFGINDQEIKFIDDINKTAINFEKVKDCVDKIFCIFSDNDPFIPVSQADLLKDKLEAFVFFEKNQGHFTKEDGFEKLETNIFKLII